MRIQRAPLLLLLLLAPAARATPSCCSSDGQMIATSCGANPDDNLDDSAALNLALQCPSPQGTPSVRFPDGRYIISAPVASSLDNLTLNFGAGSTLEFRGAGLTLSGVRNRLSGLRCRLPVAASSAFTVLTLSGKGSAADDVSFDVQADVPSATLLRLAADHVRASRLRILADARPFAYGVHIQAASGGEARWVRVDGLDVDLDPNDAHRTCVFGALVYFRGKESALRDLSMYEGDRMQFPDGVIIMDGHVDTLENVNFVASGAKYGVYRKYGAEFLTLLGGRLDGVGGGAPRTADSEGIHNEQFAGHLKVYGTLIVGWQYGVGFHGSHDTPGFFGAPIANNGIAAILVDSSYMDPAYGNTAPADWPVTGMTIQGVYFEEEADPNEAFLLLRSGALLGVTIQSSQIAIISRAIKVESTMGENGPFIIQGNRFQASPGAALVEAGPYTSAWYGPNATFGGPALTAGAYGSRVKNADTPNPSSLTLGPSDGPLTGHYRYSFTANFANALTANTSAELSFSVPAAAPNDSISCTLTAPLASNVSLALQACYMTGWGTMALRMRNVSAVDQTSVSGGLAVDVWKH